MLGNRRLTPESFTLVLITGVAFVVRVWGARAGLPHLYYWDEPTVVNRAVRFGSGDFNPHFFYYPALYMYVLFAISGACYLFGRLTHAFASVQDFAVEYIVDPTRVYLWARVTTALFGVATVLVTYVVVARFFQRRVGLVAAALLAVSVLHASHSHIAVTDVPQTFFIMAALVPIHAIFVRAHRRDYLAAGLLIGLGAATKYLAILLAPTLLLAHLARRGSPETSSSPARERRRAWPQLVLAGVTICAGFVMGAPYNVLRVHEFRADWSRQMTLSEGTAGGSGSVWCFGRTLIGDLGWPICLLAVAGLAWILARRERGHLLFLTFPVVYFLAVAQMTKVFARYMIPEDPFLAALAAVAIVAAADRLQASRRTRALAIAAATTAFAALPLRTLLRWDALMARKTDPRTAALAWAETHVPAGAVVAIQSLYGRTFSNVPLLTDHQIAKIESELPATGALAAARQRVAETFALRPIYRLAPWQTDFDALANAGVRYVFTSDAMPPLPVTFAAALERGARAKQVFAPDPEELRRMPAVDGVVAIVPPRITVYELR